MGMSKVFIVVDLGFGDAGKGSVVDYFTRQFAAHTVVRFNGGAQAGHNVITSEGQHHVFSQFGSGSFVPGVRNYLSEYMMVNPLNLMKEAAHVESFGLEPFENLVVDKNALITTPFHQAVNRLREIDRGKHAHGSCGMGIGETRLDWSKGLGLATGDIGTASETVSLKHLQQE